MTRVVAVAKSGPAFTSLSLAEQLQRSLDWIRQREAELAECRYELTAAGWDVAFAENLPTDEQLADVHAQL